MNMGRDRFTKISKVVFTVALAAFFFGAGGYISQVTAKPQVTVEPEIRTKIVDRVVRVPVEKIVEKEVM